MAASIIRRRINLNHLKLIANDIVLNHVSRNAAPCTVGVQCRYCGTSTSVPDISLLAQKSQKISQAMQLYMEKAQSYDKLLQQETEDFEIGKRHVANIMGLDPDTITQEEIDSAITYLLPSGLFDKKARPLLKHPQEVFPKKKAVQFDTDGRPFHYLFYTGKPNYYEIMHSAALKLEELKELQALKRPQHQQQKPLSLQGSDWISQQKLEQRILEKISEHDYGRFTRLLASLAGMKFSEREKDFILQFREILVDQSRTLEVTQPSTDSSGRKYMEGEGIRKTSKAWCRVTTNGHGNILINKHHDITYFRNIEQREQVLFPLSLSGLLGSVDLEARVEGGGTSGQAGALRLAMSRALASLLPVQIVEKMRLAGLLTKDVRLKERQKPGQERARKKFTWKKR